METVIIKQKKSRKGTVVAISVIGAAIHTLIRGAYRMSLLDCLIILLVFALSAVIIVFAVNTMFKQTIYIEQDRFVMKIGVLTHSYYYNNIVRCIYRDAAYLKFKLENGKNKEIYLGEFDFDDRQQFIAVIKGHNIPVDELSI